MRFWSGRLLWSSLAAVIVLVTAFWITLQLTTDPYEWAAEPPSGNSAIQVTEASYGLNCSGFKPRPGIANTVKAGNATTTISELCDKALESCEFFADLGQMPDPAPGCDKDLSIKWRCGREPKINALRVPPRADGKLVSLRCP
jgi:hypothetical protein